MMNLIKRYFPNRHLICKYFPKLAEFIWWFHKGVCIDCIDCCIKQKEKPCKDLDIENKRCRIHKTKPLHCKVTPFPQDLWWDKRYKNCKIYYFFKSNYDKNKETGK